MDKVGKSDMKLVRSRGEIVPRDFAAAVKDIKLAILQSRARAAHASNVEALKLYFYVGGYISKKTRTAKWGSGAIDALSNRLYISWMLEPCESRCPAEMEVVFRSETFAGDEVRVETAAADGYTYHRVSAPDGKDHIVARTKG